MRSAIFPLYFIEIELDNWRMQYHHPVTSLEAFYQTLYAIPARKSRAIITPRMVTQRLLQSLGNPQHDINSILITGSKGKGSTAIFLSNLLQAAGCSVGRFSSPHLVDYRERIVVNERWIDEADLLRLANRVFQVVNAQTYNSDAAFPRFFEITTAIAYLYFAEQNVNLAVIETGIGALTDATNQGAHQLAILTTIEAEHLDIFGEVKTLTLEKAGVMQAGKPVILGEIKTALAPLIVQQAKQLGVPVIQTAINSDVVKVREKIWQAPSQVIARNAVLALAAFEQLAIHLSASNIIACLEKTRLPARQEVVSKKPLIVIDSAHTTESALQLANYVSRLKETTTAVGQSYLLLSFSAVKNIRPVLSAFPGATNIVVTRASGRSLEPKVIVSEIATFDELHPMTIEQINDPIEAMETVWHKLKEADSLMITGSMYLAGLATQYFSHYSETV